MTADDLYKNPPKKEAFGIDERTVLDWWQRAGKHSQKVYVVQILTTGLIISLQTNQPHADSQRLYKTI
jgi:hypothetical protein